MPTLNEYLGGLFASIARARAASDMQTAQIAEQYARHDLLKHFSVPRMRFDDIELTVPVAIDSLAAVRELQLDPIGNAGFRALVHRELASPLGMAVLPLAAGQALDAKLDARIAELAERIRDGARDEAFSIFAKYAVDDFSRIVSTYGLGTNVRIDYGALAERLMKIAPEVIRGVVEKQTIDQLEVVAESYRLREQRPQDLIYIKMVVSEDGMEWQTIERADGSVERKLLPE